MMRTFLIVMCSCLVIKISAQANHSLTGLLNFGPQANFLHPAYAPQGKFFLGLPVLSRLSFHTGSRFSLRDFVASNTISALLQQDNNSLALEGQISDFLIGYRTPKDHYISVFSNENVFSFLYYPKSLLNFIEEGNTKFINDRSDFIYLREDLIAYREIGLGYNWPIHENLRLGVHFKYIQGLLHMQIPETAQLSIQVEEQTRSNTISFKDFEIHSVGIPLDSTSAFPSETDYYIFNNNNGFAFDAGFSYTFSPSIDLHASIRDIGSVQWRERAKRHTPAKSSVTLNGVDLDRTSDIAALTDTLTEAIELQPESITYRTRLHYSLFSTLVFRITQNHALSLSYMTRRLAGESLGSLQNYYSVSYKQRVSPNFSFSTSAIRYPQKFALGLGFVHNIGLWQMYGSLGDILGFLDVPDLQLFDINLGVNIIIGGRTLHDQKSQL